ncbi:hypothetical protein [Luedemannella flava]|uniref:hypothetical protein n=1 Tax=Luedemannella flava TaxID=349316 RepID=UPI0031DF9498
MNASELMSATALLISTAALIYARSQARSTKEQAVAAVRLTTIESQRRAREVTPPLKISVKGDPYGPRPKLRLRVTRSGNAHPLEVKVALHEPTFGWRFSESGADVVGCTIGPNGSTDLPLSSVPKAGFRQWNPKFGDVAVTVTGAVDGHDWTSPHTVSLPIPRNLRRLAIDD